MWFSTNAIDSLDSIEFNSEKLKSDISFMPLISLLNPLEFQKGLVAKEVYPER